MQLISRISIGFSYFILFHTNLHYSVNFSDQPNICAFVILLQFLDLGQFASHHGQIEIAQFWAGSGFSTYLVGLYKLSIWPQPQQQFAISLRNCTWQANMCKYLDLIEIEHFGTELSLEV